MRVYDTTSPLKQRAVRGDAIRSLGCVIRSTRRINAEGGFGVGLRVVMASHILVDVRVLHVTREFQERLLDIQTAMRQATHCAFRVSGHLSDVRKRKENDDGK